MANIAYTLSMPMTLSGQVLSGNQEHKHSLVLFPIVAWKHSTSEFLFNSQFHIGREKTMARLFPYQGIRCMATEQSTVNHSYYLRQNPIFFLMSLCKFSFCIFGSFFLKKLKINVALLKLSTALKMAQNTD